MYVWVSTKPSISQLMFFVLFLWVWADRCFPPWSPGLQENESSDAEMDIGIDFDTIPNNRSRFRYGTDKSESGSIRYRKIKTKRSELDRRQRYERRKLSILLNSFRTKKLGCTRGRRAKRYRQLFIRYQVHDALELLGLTSIFPQFDVSKKSKR